MREQTATTRGRVATRSRSGQHRRWLGDEVHEHSGTIGEMADLVPTFRRQPLAIANLDDTKSIVNWSRDLIVKCGSPSGEDELPIGVVLRQYRLVQHTAVLAHAADAIESAGIFALPGYDEKGWCATFYTTGMEHSPTSATGTGWERTSWHATRRAAWEAAQPRERLTTLRNLLARLTRGTRFWRRTEWVLYRIVRDGSQE